MNNLFNNRIKTEDKTRVPVWFMRQAGRYHQHYQNIKKGSDFMSMCKNPQLACDVTMGPIDEFDFDAAILFSDLLFPLEFLNLGLTYRNGPPELAVHLCDDPELKNVKPIADATQWFDFQGQACKKLRSTLPDSKGLIGFVGSPFTLYTYASEGSHSGNLVASKQGLFNGLFNRFCELLIPAVLEEMRVQARNGVDTIAIFDTAAGELCAQDYGKFVAPLITEMVDDFKADFPNINIIYYSKFTHFGHIDYLMDSKINALGVDWRHDLSEVFKRYGHKFFIQGNIDPIWLHLNWNDLESNLNEYKAKHFDNIDPSKWIFGLGHGVTVKTPEINVKKTVEWVHQNLLY